MESLTTINSTKAKLQAPDCENVIHRSDHSFRHTGSLEILQETVRILKSNPTTFFAISTLLIYPVSAFHLSNQLVDQSVIDHIAEILLSMFKSSGLSSIPFVKHSCQRISELIISSIISFPLYCTLLLVSKAAVVYCIERTYSRKKIVCVKFIVIMRMIWRRVISTYLLICALIVGCVTLFMMLLMCVSRLLYIIGFLHNSIASIVVVTVLFFLVFLVYTIIICDISVVISVSEDVSGLQALVRSSVLIRGQTRVGLMVFLGSTIGMVIVKGLIEHQVKSLTYGDAGSSRTWERPALVLMYSFVVLIDFMMSTVFFFSCKSCSLEAVDCGM